MPNAITLLFQPGRLLWLCLGVMLCYGAVLASTTSENEETTELLRVELLR
jgi:hypothetical protein